MTKKTKGRTVNKNFFTKKTNLEHANSVTT